MCQSSSFFACLIITSVVTAINVYQCIIQDKLSKTEPERRWQKCITGALSHAVDKPGWELVAWKSKTDLLHAKWQTWARKWCLALLTMDEILPCFWFCSKWVKPTQASPLSIQLKANFMGCQCIHHSNHFYASCPLCHNSGLRKALSFAGMHTLWLD